MPVGLRHLHMICAVLRFARIPIIIAFRLVLRYGSYILKSLRALLLSEIGSCSGKAKDKMASSGCERDGVFEDGHTNIETTPASDRTPTAICVSTVSTAAAVAIPSDSHPAPIRRESLLNPQLQQLSESRESPSSTSHHYPPSIAGIPGEAVVQASTNSRDLIVGSVHHHPEGRCGIEMLDGDREYARIQALNAGASMPTIPCGHALREYMPLETPRYSRRGSAPKKRPRFTVPPLCFSFPYSRQGEDLDLRGWKSLMHPEGALYFYHPKKRVFTEAYLYDETYLCETEMLVDFLEETLEALGAQVPSEYDLVVQVEKAGHKDGWIMLWQYYYVDHSARGLFWLRPYELDDRPSNPAHFKLLLESWYWEHITLFPDHFPSHNTFVDELVGQLTFFCIENTTSLSSIVPYARDELTTMIGLLDRKEPGSGSIHNTAALGRMMSIFCHWRYTNGHGQLYARLDRIDSTFDVSKRKRSWAMEALRLLLFYAPEVHLRDIERLYVDRTIIAYLREQHVAKLQGEWSEFVLYSTVVLGANVSMLSVPDVVRLPETDATNMLLLSPAAIANYVSILFSVGSIVLGLLLVRYHRTRDLESASTYITEILDEEIMPDVAEQPVTPGIYEQEATMADLAQQPEAAPVPIPDHEPLAILYSLPYALLIWAMLSFTVSILSFTLGNTDIATQSIVATTSCAVLCLVVWCVIAFWQSSTHAQRRWMAVKLVLTPRWSGRRADTTSTAHGSDSEGWLRTHMRSLAERMRKVESVHSNTV